jgi:hypothetical protein
MQALIALIHGGHTPSCCNRMLRRVRVVFLFNKTYNFAGRKREEAGHFYLQLKINANRFC